MIEPATLHELSDLISELQSSELIGSAEVAARLEVTPEEIRGWAIRGILPFQRVSGRLVFRLADILRWELDGIERLGDPLARPGEIL